ncbi:ROK family protein [Magnetospirillum gryphiswaldense]|uniref:ROK n=1 Tax=Magnetospirillum gryphiswaldense TaxID=55518 RepID=A4U489_9PROT|nr:ROK family protein [Magnetospirillum gryphiswaldense]AVM73485.1 Fructokinase [Magnetospirillum gryphiswaldense MSR-1]AVM77388.1 Fructokinase [Magnetospirillum gryphiswaldense]CAM77696.1 ROK [Magnetospirillum gryphiswaldense MSR-1]
MNDDRKPTLRIGIDLGGTKTEAIALDRDSGAELDRLRVATARGSYDGTVATIRDLVLGLENRLGRGGSVGVGIPGTISAKTGLVKNANSTWLIGRPFDRDLATALARPVRLANDADCFALSEATDGAGQGADIVFGVILGTGVGGGVVVHGRLLAGANAIAGEWGHNPLPWPQADEIPGHMCYCGKVGCIETFLSGPGLERQHGHGLRVPDILALAERGDDLAEGVLACYEDRLARALAGVINIVDPQVIVLGGGVGNMARLYRNVPRLWGEYVFSDTVETKLLPPTHGDSSGVRGAAWLW